MELTVWSLPQERLRIPARPRLYRGWKWEEASCLRQIDL